MFAKSHIPKSSYKIEGETKRQNRRRSHARFNFIHDEAIKYAASRDPKISVIIDRIDILERNDGGIELFLPLEIAKMFYPPHMMSL